MGDPLTNRSVPWGLGDGPVFHHQEMTMNTPDTADRVATQDERDARYAGLRLALAEAHLRELGITSTAALRELWITEDRERDERRHFQRAALVRIQATAQ